MKSELFNRPLGIMAASVSIASAFMMRFNVWVSIVLAIIGIFLAFVSIAQEGEEKRLNTYAAVSIVTSCVTIILSILVVLQIL
jgi:uncharacterized membrane protein